MGFKWAGLCNILSTITISLNFVVIICVHNGVRNKKSASSSGFGWCRWLVHNGRGSSLTTELPIFWLLNCWMAKHVAVSYMYTKTTVLVSDCSYYMNGTWNCSLCLFTFNFLEWCFKQEEKMLWILIFNECHLNFRLWFIFLY